MLVSWGVEPERAPLGNAWFPAAGLAETGRSFAQWTISVLSVPTSPALEQWWGEMVDLICLYSLRAKVLSLRSQVVIYAFQRVE